MPLLQVRDFPEDLYKTLAEIAEQDNRSIAQETIVLLKKALNYKESRQARRKRILNEIYNNPIRNVETFPDPAALIREDRER
ncbi:hypothetical protein [Gracilinema caldarium]|uniref:Uncharacterized protein n=1 Tax=Gracilinema caldarium (strain ATCC 51460 / DSM 7334 / H1) TaxID=744872 RepID=F8EZT1_GRAC1|nr:hypothetical protein [Gracilinema caldarium]AEJ18444.1 hypothetical protein Spica_0278 [Gracilinema caldarium DSM 7334]